MRHGIQVQVPSSLQILRYLRNGTPIISTPSQVSSSQNSIRQIPNPIVRSFTVRSFSTTRAECAIHIPIQSNLKISRKSRSRKPKPSAFDIGLVSAKESQFVLSHKESLKDDPVAVMTLIYIHRQQYDKILPFLLEQKSKVTSGQLEEILKELEIRDLSSYIIQIHTKFPAISFANEQTIKLLLRVAFKSSDYALFEIIFSRYLELPEQTSRYCNMALKAAILNRNQEFAKQLLYQMVQSHLPMNLGTLKVFLSSVKKSGTFQSILFAVDLLQKNPQIPVDKDTLSIIMKCYAQNAESTEIEKLTKFLQYIECDLYEFELYQLYESFKHRLPDHESLWTTIDEIRAKVINDERLLRNFYVQLLSIFASKLKRDDLFKLVNYAIEDCGEFLPKIHLIMLSYFSTTGDVEGILDYFNFFKEKSAHIQPVYVNALWRTLVKYEPDLSKKITEEFKSFLNNVYTQTQLNHPYLNTISVKESEGNSLPLYVPETSDGQLAKSIHHVKNLLKEKRDREIISFINDELRQGLRPQYEVLHTALVGLITLKSPESRILFKLSCQLYKYRTVEFELLWLRKTIADMKNEQNSKNSAIYELGGGIIRDFNLKYENELMHKHYNIMGNLAIEVFNYDLAFELLRKARGSPIEAEKRDITSIYVTLLKVFARKQDSKSLLYVMNLAHSEPDLKLTKFFIKRLKTYNQYFTKLSSQDRFENIEEFQANFDSEFEKIKERYTAQRKLAQANCKKSIMFLEEWNKIT